MKIDLLIKRLFIAVSFCAQIKLFTNEKIKRLKFFEKMNFFPLTDISLDSMQIEAIYSPVICIVKNLSALQWGHSCQML